MQSTAVAAGAAHTRSGSSSVLLCQLSRCCWQRTRRCLRERFLLPTSSSQGPILLLPSPGLPKGKRGPGCVCACGSQVQSRNKEKPGNNDQKLAGGRDWAWRRPGMQQDPEEVSLCASTACLGLSALDASLWLITSRNPCGYWWDIGALGAAFWNPIPIPEWCSAPSTSCATSLPAPFPGDSTVCDRQFPVLGLVP